MKGTVSTGSGLASREVHLDPPHTDCLGARVLLRLAGEPKYVAPKDVVRVRIPNGTWVRKKKDLMEQQDKKKEHIAEQNSKKHRKKEQQIKKREQQDKKKEHIAETSWLFHR